MAGYESYLVQIWLLEGPHKICKGVKEQASFDSFEEAWEEQFRLLKDGVMCSIIRER